MKIAQLRKDALDHSVFFWFPNSRDCESIPFLKLLPLYIVVYIDFMRYILMGLRGIYNSFTVSFDQETGASKIKQPITALATSQ